MAGNQLRKHEGTELMSLKIDSVPHLLDIIKKENAFALTSHGTHGGGGSGHVIQDEGVSLTARTNLNFAGSGVIASDAGGSTTTITIPGSGSALQQPQNHDTTHSPVALWQLDGDLLDSSGNGHTLVPAGLATHATDANYVASGLVPGKKALACQNMCLQNTGSAFHILGDITVLMLIFDDGVIRTNSQNIIAWSTYGPATGVNNTSYNLLFGNSSTYDGKYLAYHEHGSAGSPTGPIFIVPGHSVRTRNFYEWSHLVMRRESNVYTIFINGVNVGSSGTVTAPDGGGSSTLQIAGFLDVASYDFQGLLQSVKIVSGSLTDAQIVAEAERCLGITI